MKHLITLLAPALAVFLFAAATMAPSEGSGDPRLMCIGCKAEVQFEDLGMAGGLAAYRLTRSIEIDGACAIVDGSCMQVQQCLAAVSAVSTFGNETISAIVNTCGAEAEDEDTWNGQQGESGGWVYAACDSCTLWVRV